MPQPCLSNKRMVFIFPFRGLSCGAFPILFFTFFLWGSRDLTDAIEFYPLKKKRWTSLSPIAFLPHLLSCFFLSSFEFSCHKSRVLPSFIRPWTTPRSSSRAPPYPPTDRPNSFSSVLNPTLRITGSARHGIPHQPLGTHDDEWILWRPKPFLS